MVRGKKEERRRCLEICLAIEMKEKSHPSTSASQAINCSTSSRAKDESMARASDLPAPTASPSPEFDAQLTSAPFNIRLGH